MYKAKLRGTDVVAVKYLTCTVLADQPEVTDFVKEVNLLRSCKHTNILLFLGAWLGDPVSIWDLGPLSLLAVAAYMCTGCQM